MKKIIKRFLKYCGTSPEKVIHWLGSISLRMAVREQKTKGLIERLRDIVPDITQQEESEKGQFNPYLEIKRRSLQAFQCRLMLDALKGSPAKRITVVDIGDSCGTHMLYLKSLRETGGVDTISVNLDIRAIKKIEARGLKAILCRAEELRLDSPVDLATSFEMVEHLHNPAIFFRRMAKQAVFSRMVITVPYMRNSRVGLHHLRAGNKNPLHAEDEHIFELSPGDWELLLKHSGWKVVKSEVYYQYPRSIFGLRRLWVTFWKAFDFEGFWGAVLERDTQFSDLYLDWEK